jgi:hypothetical protein
VLPPLLDHHCHSVTVADLGPEAFRSLLTQSDRPPAADPLDSALGLAVRRWCPPALGLPEHATADAYLARRRELGPVEATRRLLGAAGLSALLVDTGLDAAAGQPLLPLAELSAVTGAPVHQVVRLESVAERLAARAPAAADWSGALTEALAAELVPRQATFAPSRRPARTLAAPAESPSTSSTRTSGRHADSTHRTPLLDGQKLPDAALDHRSGVPVEWAVAMLSGP